MPAPLSTLHLFARFGPVLALLAATEDAAP
jgi:hypothetical protein